MELPPGTQRPRRLHLPLGLLVALVSGGLSCNIVPDEEFCARDEDCQQRPGGANLVCDDVLHVCEDASATGCRRDANCPSPDRPRCDRATSQCVPCTPPPVDGPSDVCAHFRDPPRPFCLKGAGEATVCAECRSNRDCPVGRPICDGNACRPCREHKECGPEVVCDDGSDGGQPCKDSWVCMSDEDNEAVGVSDELKGKGGRCAWNKAVTGRVVYARNFRDMVGYCDDRWPGTYEMPVCSLDAALQLALQAPERVRYVRLLGTIFKAPAAPLMGRDVRLVIVGAETTRYLVATVEDNRTLFQVSGGARVVLDQMKLMEMAPNTTVVSCNGVPNLQTGLTIRRSVITGNTTPGAMGIPRPAIFSSDCDASILLSWVGALSEGDMKAHGGGLQIAGMGGRVRITGNIIAGNHGPALNLGLPDIELRFNTVAKNRGTFGGIICPFTGKVTLRESIVLDNMAMGMGQFIGNCEFENVVAWPAPMGGAPGLVGEDPKLGPTFHLQPASTACLDKVPLRVGLPDRDIDGDRRPQGSAWDIGADELPSK